MNLHPVSALILAVSLFTRTAAATSFYIRPFSEFTRTAPNIVHGTLHNIQVENGITADGSKTIYTYANVEVKETLKGSITAPSIRVRKIGGTKDGVTLEVPSSPEFTENEESVLYLSDAREDQSYEVTGLELGKFGTREENGELYLTGGILGYAESDAPHSAATPNPELSENHRPWTLNQLRELIHRQDPGMKSAPPSQSHRDAHGDDGAPTDTTSASGMPGEQNTHDQHHQSASTEPNPEHTTPVWAFVLVGGLALGIFLFFKNRG